MKSCWLQRGTGGDCLLFVSGWGMGPEPFTAVDFGPIDVLLIYDYRSMESSAVVPLVPQQRLHLLAWSMGVWAAAWLARYDPLFARLRFSSTTALGGTLFPLDERCGIPAAQFKTLLDTFSPANMEQFYHSMFASAEEAERFLHYLPRRSSTELREELHSLYECSSTTQLPDIYNRRLVTARDRVFSPRNQVRAWGRERCETLPLPHFPFYQAAGLKAVLSFPPKPLAGEESPLPCQAEDTLQPAR